MFEPRAPRFIWQAMSPVPGAFMKQTPQGLPAAGGHSRGHASSSEERNEDLDHSTGNEHPLDWLEGWGKVTGCSLKLEKHNSIPFTISLQEKSIGPRSTLLTELN